MSAVSSASGIQFGPFRLSGPNGPLLRGDEEIKLQAKALAVLWLLAQQAGEVVAKRALLDAVWPGATVGEDVLSYQVLALRKALGEDARNPQYIGTAHRVGFRLLVPVSKGEGSPAAGSARPGFVGRAPELQRLQQAWDAAQRGQRQLVFVSGEAGIGKTALIEHFLDRSGVDRARIGNGRCTTEAHGAGEAFRPVIDALSEWVRNYPDGSIIDLLRRLAPTWLRQIPGLLRPEERVQLDRELAGAPPERIQREFVDLLDALGSESAWVLCLEDLHWADAATVGLLSLIASRRRPNRLLILGSVRPADAILSEHPIRSVQRSLLVRGEAEELLLDVLSAPEISDYLDRNWQRSRLSAETGQAVAGKSGGHPLFLAQIIAWLARLPDDQAPTAEQLDAAVPEQLIDMVGLQLNHLPLGEQLLLEVASLIGAEFSAAAVAAAAQLEIEDVEVTLDRLLAQGQFIQHGGLDVWPDGTVSTLYRFRHALYARVMTQRISPSRKRRMHGLLAERLSTAYGARSAEIAAALTQHFEAAGQYRAAVEYGIHVARAAQVGAVTRAVLEQKTRCLRLLEKLAPLPEDQLTEFTLRLLAASALQLEQGYWSTEAIPDLVRVRELLPMIESPQMAPMAVAALTQRWAHAMWSGNSLEAARVSDEAAQLGETRDLPELRCAAHAWRCHALIPAGRSREARDAALRALEIAEAAGAGPRSARPYFALGAALSGLGPMQWMLGFPDRGLEEARLAVEVYQKVGSQVDVAAATCGGVLLLLGYRGEWQALATAAEEVHRLSLKHHHLDGQLWSERARALASYHLESNGENLARIGASIEAQLRRGGPMNLVINYCQYAECCLQQDQPERAATALRDARVLVDRYGMVGWLPELLRLEALLLARTPGREAEAEAGLRAALALADARGVISLSLRAAMALHGLLSALGRRAEGVAELRGCYDRFTEGFDTADLRAAARRLGLPPPGG